MTDSAIAPSPEPSKILTRSEFSKFTNQLDASDVLECYGLVRNAPLHQPQLNVTFTVQKMAVGFRYLPSVSSLHQKPLELTLEYGPLRVNLLDEAMPVLQNNGEYLAWSNTAKVYYTTTPIHSLSWKSAYYMASLTGAVLETVLENAVAYAETKPRYQPLSVWQNDKQILRSSSSVDFVYSVWGHMSELGVDIRPILKPPTYLPRLFVQGYRKVSGLQNGELVTKSAASFYEKLQDCWTSIATEDYSRYRPATGMPSTAPTQTPSVSILPSVLVIDSPMPSVRPETDSPSSSPLSLVPSATTATISPSSSSSSDKDDSSRRLTDTLEEVAAEMNQDKGQTNKVEENPDEVPEDEQDEEPESVPAEEGVVDGETLAKVEAEAVSEPLNDTEPEDNKNDAEEPGDTDEGSPPVDSHLGDFTFFNETSFPSVSPDSVTDIQKVSDEVNQTITKLKNSTNGDVGTAAEEITDAAQNLLDATLEFVDATAAKTAMESLLSSDGKLVASALQQCFSDPQFGIHNGNGTIGYLYLDGSSFYKLNMTPPYIDVVKFERSLPEEKTRAHNEGGDVVDISLAIMLIIFLVLGFFVLLQQIGCRLAFYSAQKRFFSPGRKDDDDLELEEDATVNSMRTDGELFDDNIPFSMGGRGSPYTNKPVVRITGGVGDTAMNNTATRSGSSNGLHQRSTKSRHNRQDGMDTGRNGLSRHNSNGDIELVRVGSGDLPHRFTRHPDLVDMPNLLSSSKVAMPVTPRSLSGDTGGGGDQTSDSPNELLVV